MIGGLYWQAFNQYCCPALKRRIGICEIDSNSPVTDICIIQAQTSEPAVSWQRLDTTTKGLVPSIRANNSMRLHWQAFDQYCCLFLKRRIGICEIDSKSPASDICIIQIQTCCILTQRTGWQDGTNKTHVSFCDFFSCMKLTESWSEHTIWLMVIWSLGRNRRIEERE